MRVAYNGTNVVTQQGVQTTAGFKIVASAHAFRILSSGLYADKIGAVLREIGCNAADAHIEVGTPTRAFEVKLPNALDPSFHIRDWGPGLDHEQVMGLYTTYFSSTKSESNDYTGAFGLGSKSPYSYIDSFAVTTVKHGVERHYVAHLDESGSPALSLLKEQPATADWPHGLLVSFPVAKTDFGEFQTKAAQVFGWFTVRPRVIGNSVVWPETDWVYNGTTLRIPKASSRSGGNVARVVMGNVAYPLVLRQLGAQVTPVQQALVDRGAHLYLPIGAVQVAASREELQYDPTSRAALLTALDQGSSELAVKLLTEYRAAVANRWQQQVQLAQLHRQLGLTKDLVQHLLQQTDATASEAEAISLAVSQLATKVPAWVGDGPLASLDTPVRAYLLVKNDQKVRKVELVAGQLPGTRHQPAATAALHYRPETRLYISTGPHAPQRVRAAVADLGHGAEGLLLVPSTKATPKEVVLAAGHRLAAELGGIPVVLTMDLPLPAALKQSRIRAKQKTQPLQTTLPTVEGSYLDLTASTLQTTRCSFAAIPATGQVFLLRARATYRRRPTYCLDESVEATAITEDALHRGLGHYQALVQRGLLPQPLTGVLVVSTQELRRWQLRTAGWRSLKEALVAQFTPVTTRARLRAETEPLPQVNLANSEHCWNYQGWVAGLASELAKSTRLGQRLEAELGDTSVLALAKRLVLANQPSRKPAQSIQANLTGMAEALGLSPLPGKVDRVASLYDLEQQFLASCPLLRLVPADQCPRARRKSEEHLLLLLKFLLQRGCTLGTHLPPAEQPAAA